MKPYILVLLVFMTQSLWGQKTYEQLLVDIKKHSPQDSIRVELLVDACVAATFRADTLVLKMATEANQLSNKLGYELGKIRSLNCLGNYYFSRALNDKAINFYLQALRIAEKRNDYSNIVIGKSNLANVFSHNFEDQKSIKLLNECDQLLLKNGQVFTQNRAAILTNLANSYFQLKQYTKAIQTYNEVLAICQKLNIGFGLALTLDNLGKTYFELKQYPKALDYFEKAKIEIEKHHVDFVRGKNLNNIGKTYSALGNSTKGLKFLQQAKAIALQNQDNEALRDIYFEMQKGFAQTNQFKAAFEHLEKYSILKDSVFSSEKNKTIQELNTKYETEKKDSEIKSLAQQKQISELESGRKTAIIYTILAFLLVGSMMAYALFMRFKTQKQNELLTTQLEEAQRRIEIEQKATESELKALKSQMNPHFMFNALNSIQEQFMYGDKTLANEQMGNFTYLTRQILSISGKKRITLATEIELLTKYLELEKMRFSEGFSYEISLDDQLDEDYHQLPPMLIQPFVENSIKHGLLHKNGDKRLSIMFSMDETEEHIICVVEDNGVGRAKSAEIKQKRFASHESFSTAATSERLRLLSSSLNSQELVHYDDLLDEQGQSLGTRVMLKIPL